MRNLSALRGQRADEGTIQLKMVSPDLRAWVVKGNQVASLRVKRANVGSLVSVTAGARQSKVVGFCSATMLSGDDMVWFVPVDDCRLGQ